MAQGAPRDEGRQNDDDRSTSSFTARMFTVLIYVSTLFFLYSVPVQSQLQDQYDEEIQHYGGPIGTPPSDGSIRFSGINPNGIPLHSASNVFKHSQDQMIYVQCYSEINLDTNKSHVIQKLNSGAKTCDNQAKTIWGSSVLPSTSTYKPGGTGITVLGKTARRCISTKRDDLGRWTRMTLKGA